MKSKILLLLLFLIIIFTAGCDREDTEPQQTIPPETEPDVVTTASIVDNEADFKKAISNEGSWLIAITRDLTIDEDILLDGEFKNGKKDEDGNDIIQRKVALYSQDENRNVSNRYTLTAPEFTVDSPNASIEHGTFIGDLYVTAGNFRLVDARVDGDIYFSNRKVRDSFRMNSESEITGKQELKE